MISEINYIHTDRQNKILNEYIQKLRENSYVVSRRQFFISSLWTGTWGSVIYGSNTPLQICPPLSTNNNNILLTTQSQFNKQIPSNRCCKAGANVPCPVPLIACESKHGVQRAGSASEPTQWVVQSTAQETLSRRRSAGYWRSQGMAPDGDVTS